MHKRERERKQKTPPYLVFRVLRQQVKRADRQPELAAVREPADGRAQVDELVPRDAGRAPHQRRADVVDAVAVQAEHKGALLVVVVRGRSSTSLTVVARRGLHEPSDVLADVLVQLLEDGLGLLRIGLDWIGRRER